MATLSRRSFLAMASIAGVAIIGGCGSRESLRTDARDIDVENSDRDSVGDETRQHGEGADAEPSAPDVGAAAVATAVPSTFDLDRRFVTLGEGIEMPINGLGTYSLVGQVCIDSVKSALKCGVRLIDTAHIYGNEAEVGRAVRESGISREEIFVITKLYPSQYAHASQAIEEALSKLDIGHLDMMLLHHPGDGDVEAYRAMEAAYGQGLIRSLGLSCFYVDEMQRFLPNTTVKPALVQNEMHPYYQDAEVVNFMHDNGIALQAWYPLGGRGHNAELLSDPVLAKIAAAHGVSIAQTILRWNLQRGVTVVPGSENPEHIREDAAVYDFTLSAEEMDRISGLNRNEKHDWY